MPVDLLLIMNGPNRIELEWTLDDRDEFPATRFKLRIAKMSGLGLVDIPDREISGIQGTSGRFVLDNLAPATSYRVRMFASNQHGDSVSSLTRTFNTERKSAAVHVDFWPRPVCWYHIQESKGDQCHGKSLLYYMSVYHGWVCGCVRG